MTLRSRVYFTLPGRTCSVSRRMLLMGRKASKGSFHGRFSSHEDGEAKEKKIQIIFYQELCFAFPSQESCSRQPKEYGYGYTTAAVAGDRFPRSTSVLQAIPQVRSYIASSRQKALFHVCREFLSIGTEAKQFASTKLNLSSTSIHDFFSTQNGYIHSLHKNSSIGVP